jgi:hypothetical protein
MGLRRATVETKGTNRETDRIAGRSQLNSANTR